MSAAVSSSRIEHRFSRKPQSDFNSPTDVHSRRQLLTEKAPSVEREEASRKVGSKKTPRELLADQAGGGCVLTSKGFLCAEPAIPSLGKKKAQNSHATLPEDFASKISVDRPISANQTNRQDTRSKVVLNSLNLVDRESSELAEHIFGTPTGTPCSSLGTSVSTPYGSYGDVFPELSTSGGLPQFYSSGTHRSPGACKGTVDKGDMRRGEYGRGVAWNHGDDSTGRSNGDMDSRMLGPSTPSSRRSERSESTISEFFDANDAPFSEASTSDDEGFGSARSLARRQERERESTLSQHREDSEPKIAVAEPLPAVKTRGQHAPQANGEVPEDAEVIVAPLAASSSAAAEETEAQEVLVARAVARAIARGIARGEAELATEGEMECKNREIARLSDKLQYWERMNHEMAQARELAIEQTRQKRRARQRFQWWVVGGSLGASVVIAAVAVGIYALGQSRQWEFGSLLAKLQESATEDGGSEPVHVDLSESIDALANDSTA